MDLPQVASKLDGAIGLTLESAEDGVVTLRLEPGAVGVVEEDECTYLHGGTLATCVDTAAWYAAASASEATGW
jgi:acyl-coenzyme A thioesterase PaaI-like protein